MLLYKDQAGQFQETAFQMRSQERIVFDRLIGRNKPRQVTVTDHEVTVSLSGSPCKSSSVESERNDQRRAVVRDDHSWRKTFKPSASTSKRGKR